MKNEKLDALLKPLIKQGLKLIPKADESAQAASCESKFGGMPYAEHGDSWPVCSSCNQELTFISQFFDTKENILFVFYYCHECFPWGLGDEEKGQWQATIYHSPTIEKLIAIHRQTEEELTVSACSVSSSTVSVLPDWEGIEAVSSEIVALCSEIDDDEPWEVYEEAVIRSHCLSEYVTLLGGYPRYVQGEGLPSCSQCKEKMKFYAQIDSEEDADIMWGDAGVVYFYRCSEHKDEIRFELQCY